MPARSSPTTSTASWRSDADVRELRLVEPAQQRADAGQVHLDAEEIDVAAAPPRWPPSSRPCRSRSPARPARVGRKSRARSSGVRSCDAVARQQLVARALLRGRHAGPGAARSCGSRGGAPADAARRVVGVRVRDRRQRVAASLPGDVSARASMPRRRAGARSCAAPMRRPRVFDRERLRRPSTRHPRRSTRRRGVHASSLRTPSPPMRQTASSLSHCVRAEIRGGEALAVRVRAPARTERGIRRRRGAARARTRVRSPSVANSTSVSSPRCNPTRRTFVAPMTLTASRNIAQADGHQCDAQLVAVARRDPRRAAAAAAPRPAGRNAPGPRRRRRASRARRGVGGAACARAAAPRARRARRSARHARALPVLAVTR